MHSPANTCSHCGAPIDTEQSGGLCVSCLLGDAIGVRGSNDALGTMGGHELLSVIARGGMGIVYLAHQSDPEREVALKALPGTELLSPEAQQRFKLEAQSMARLDHPHILPVYQLGEEDGTPFYTMKLATGGTLAERTAHYAGKWREIAELVATLAEAVQFAHSRGVLHRDLKPGNVLFDEDGGVYVSDFGLAKLVDLDSDLTRTISLLGTPTYLAPELVNGGKGGASAASDVWSLGVMLYELLAGRPPFQAENMAALLRQIADEAPPTLNGSTSIPRDLAVITFKALAKDPARRYSTAQAFLDDLRRWLIGQPIHARPVPLAERAWLWAKRKPALAAALALLALTLLVSAVLLVRSNDQLRAVDQQRRGQIHRALLEKADAERQSMTPGRRERALQLVREALTHGTSTQARSVAASALAVSDVRVTKTWPVGRVASWHGSMAFTPDMSQHVAIVPRELLRNKTWKQGALGLWRTSDHILLKQIPLTDSRSFFLPSLSADGHYVAIEVHKRHVEVWDWQSESKVHEIQTQAGLGAQFHPSENALIVVADGELQIIPVPGYQKQVLASGLALSKQLSASPDGRLAAFTQITGTGDSERTQLEIRSLVDGCRIRADEVRLYGNTAWTQDSGIIGVFDFHTGWLNTLDVRNPHAPPHLLLRSGSSGRRIQFHPNGRLLAWADNGGFIHLHDRWSGGDLLYVPATAMTLDFSADGTRFAYNADSNTAALAEMQPSSILEQLKAPQEVERSVDRELALSPDGRWIATGEIYGISLWRTDGMAHVAHRLSQKKRDGLSNLHFSADSRQISFQCTTTRRTVWDIVEAADGKVILAGPDADGPRSEHDLVATNVNGSWECTIRPSEKNGRYYLWQDNQIKRRLLRDYNPYRVDWHHVVISADGRWMAFSCIAEESAPKPGFTYIVEFDRDKHRTFLSWQASYTYLAISPDNRWLLGGEGAGYVIWDTTTWQPTFRLPAGLSDAVPGSASFSPDGTLLALEVDHGKIRLLRVGTWEEVLTLTPPQDIPIVRMAFSPDGQHLYTTGGQILHRWDISRLKSELRQLNLDW